MPTGARKAKPKAGKKTKRSSTSKAPQAVVDRHLKVLWQQALERYHQALTSETEDWDERYEALGEILDSDPPLYLAGGYKTARAFIRAELKGEDERTLRTYIRVARYFDPEDEAKYGISKLDALLTYLEAAGGVPLAPAKINLARQTIRVPDGKITKTVPFAQATIDQLRLAIRGAKKPKPGPKESPVVKSLRSHLRKAKLGTVSIRLRNKRLDLGAIPLEKLAAVGKALATVKLPES